MEKEKQSPYREMIVWQKSMDLVIEIYKLTELFPKEEKYGLVSQMRRCAVSIPSNTAEGKRRRTKKDFLKYMNISYSSGAELETQIEIAKRLGYSAPDDYKVVDSLLDEVMRMLNTLTNPNS